MTKLLLTDMVCFCFSLCGLLAVQDRGGVCATCSYTCRVLDCCAYESIEMLQPAIAWKACHLHTPIAAFRAS